MGPCQSKGKDDTVTRAAEHNNSERAPPLVVSKSHEDEEGDMSTMENPSVSQMDGVLSPAEAMMAYGSQSVSTFDPRSYYGGARGEQSSLSDGATFSSFHMTSTQCSGRSYGFDESDSSFMYDYDYQQEQILEIYAPAGKLGLVLDTPNEQSSPIIHAIKDFSPLKDKLQVGDKLLALDDEDVRFYTAVKISKMLSRKSGNTTRKLTVGRPIESVMA